MEPGRLIMEDLPIPDLTPGNAVVKIEKCGICGSDITAYRGVNPTQTYPIHGLGHEGVGTIVEIGENEQGLKEGDRVALEPYVPDFTCHMCRVGRYNNCAHIHVCGVHKNGMMTEYFLHPVRLLHKLPDELDFTRAALTEPLAIGLHGAARARVKQGDTVAVFGAGTIGLMAGFACRALGATPILIDLVEERLEFARKELGFAHVCCSAKQDVKEYLEEATGGEMCQSMIDCTGAAAVHANMHDYVWHGGCIALVGWPHGLTTFNQTRIMQKEIDICPSRNSAGQFPTAIRLLQEDELPIRKMITRTIGMEETESVMQDMIEHPGEYLKVVINI